MKFYCDSCNAKYSIGDEKVKGKVLRIRCKRCSHIITVKGAVTPLRAEVSAPAAPAASAGHGVGAGLSDGIQWYYSRSGETFGPFELGALQGMFASGQLGDECYVWNESFTSWLPAKECGQFSTYFAQGVVRKPNRPTMTLQAIDLESATVSSTELKGASEGAAPAYTQKKPRKKVQRSLSRSMRRLERPQSSGASSPASTPSRKASHILKRASAAHDRASGTNILSKPGNTASALAPTPIRTPGRSLQSQAAAAAQQPRLTPTSTPTPAGEASGSALRRVGGGASPRMLRRSNPEPASSNGVSSPPALSTPSPMSPRTLGSSQPATGLSGGSGASDRLRALREKLSAGRAAARGGVSQPVSGGTPASPVAGGSGMPTPGLSLKERLSHRSNGGAADPMTVQRSIPEGVINALKGQQPQQEAPIPGSGFINVFQRPEKKKEHAPTSNSVLAELPDTFTQAPPNGVAPPIPQPNSPARPELPMGFGAGVGAGPLEDVAPTSPEPMPIAPDLDPTISGLAVSAPPIPQASMPEPSAPPVDRLVGVGRPELRDLVDAAPTSPEPLAMLAPDEGYRPVPPAKLGPSVGLKAGGAPEMTEAPTSRFAGEGIAVSAPPVSEPMPVPVPKPVAPAVPGVGPGAGALQPLPNRKRTGFEDGPMSHSLVIQLDSIKKNNRKPKMYAAIGAAAVLFVIAASVGVYFSFFAGKSATGEDLKERAAQGRAKNDAQAIGKADFDKQKGYSNKELGEFENVVDLGEDDGTWEEEDDAAEKDGEGVEAKDEGEGEGETPPGDDAPAAAKDDKKAGGANDDDAPGAKPRDKDKKGASVGLDVGSLVGKKKDDGLDKALLASKKVDKKEGGIKRRSDGGSGSVAKMDKKDDPKMGSVDSGSVFRDIHGSRPKVNVKRVERDRAGEEAPSLPATLNKKDLVAGFRNVRRSADQCLERHLKRSGRLPKGKVKVIVTIQNNGKVSQVAMDREVRNTLFESCMRSHTGRWRFPEFGGGALNVARVFVLQ